MKTIFKNIALVMVGVMTLASCNDWLTLEPKTKITEENFWNEGADVKQVLLYVYNVYQGATESYIAWGESRSDNVESNSQKATAGSPMYEVMNNNIYSTNRYTNWGNFYKIINTCNLIIEQAPKVQEVDPTFKMSEVKAIIAEATALRALSYFYLVRAFGDVPFLGDLNSGTHIAVVEEDRIRYDAQSNCNAILDQLIAELEGTVGNAYKKFSQADLGKSGKDCNRVTQSAIYSILADMCLWRSQWDKAIIYADKVIEQKFNEYVELSIGPNKSELKSSNYILFKHPDDQMAPSSDLIKTGNKSGYPLYACYQGTASATQAKFANDFGEIFVKGSSYESIFELDFNTSSVYGLTALANDGVEYMYGSHHVGIIPGTSKAWTPVDGQLNPNKTLFSEVTRSNADNKEINTCYMSREDVRFYYNLEPEDPESYNSGTISKYVRKSVSLDQSYKPEYALVVSDNCNDRNWIFYRFTDVLLMKAEALIERSNGNVDDLKNAFYLIWVVNHRSNMESRAATFSEANCPHTIKFDDRDKSAMEILLLKERRREFLFEGKRWFDLLRFAHRDWNNWGTYLRNECAPKYRSGGEELFPSYNSLFWPINKNELRRNKNLVQNPYYKYKESEL